MSKPDEKEPQERQDTPEEPTETTPGGLEVRTPSRGEFFSNLEKVSKPERE